MSIAGCISNMEPRIDAMTGIELGGKDSKMGQFLPPLGGLSPAVSRSQNYHYANAAVLPSNSVINPQKSDLTLSHRTQASPLIEPVVMLVILLIISATLHCLMPGCLSAGIIHMAVPRLVSHS